MNNCTLRLTVVNDVDLTEGDDLGAHTHGWHDEWMFTPAYVKEKDYIEAFSNTPEEGKGNSYFSSHQNVMDCLLASIHYIREEKVDVGETAAYLIKSPTGEWMLIEVVPEHYTP